MIIKEVICDMCGFDCSEYFIVEVHGQDVSGEYEVCKSCKNKLNNLLND